MTILSPTNLETINYGQADWWAIYNKNVELLNEDLLKLQALQDVKVDKLKDNSFLYWDSSASKWRVGIYPP
jgi:hypothetical protein